MVKKREAIYQDKILKEQETEQFQNDIISMKKKIKKLTPEFKKVSTLFKTKLLKSFTIQYNIKNVSKTLIAI